MNDYEKESAMIRACADAMGIKPNEQTVRNVNYGYALATMGYNPLKNDEQAMALVKKCGLSISGPTASDKDREFYVWCAYEAKNNGGHAQSPDLNRAIVECVASLQSPAAQGSGQEKA